MSGAAVIRNAEHDLNNQLGIILGYVELWLFDTPADDARRRELEEARRAARAALDIVARLRSEFAATNR